MGIFFQDTNYLQKEHICQWHNEAVQYMSCPVPNKASNYYCIYYRGKRSEVILGARSTKKEPEQQILSVKKAFPYPCFDKYTHEGDLQLLQVCMYLWLSF